MVEAFKAFLDKPALPWQTDSAITAIRSLRIRPLVPALIQAAGRDGIIAL